MYTARVNNQEFRVEFDKNSTTAGKINDSNFELDLLSLKPDTFHLIKDNQSFTIEILNADYVTKVFDIKINEQIYLVEMSDDIDNLLNKLGLDNKKSKRLTELKAPMPGLVTEIVVTTGAHVAKGDKLLVLQAMKMENNIKSPQDGVIKKVCCQTGVAVEKNQILIEFE